MKKENFTHLKYTPKNTIYSLVKAFNHLEHGNIIGYASEDGEVYFRLENDFGKFEFLNEGNFEYETSESAIRVKFKLDGEWKPYIYKGRKLVSFEQHIDEEVRSLELQLNNIYNLYHEKFDYYFMIDVDLENKMWKKAKENKFNEMELKQQKMILIKEKIRFIKEAMK